MNSYLALLHALPVVLATAGEVPPQANPVRPAPTAILPSPKAATPPPSTRRGALDLRAQPVSPDPERARFERELSAAYPAGAAKPTRTRRYDLRAAPTALSLIDGRMLSVWAYNGRVPAPVLRVRLGEELEVTLHNDLPQPTTIHWHGVRVPNAMDGVPGVTQEPVAPGERFVYRFTPKDAGTFWFHPHVRTSEQVERGLYGVLVVDDATPLPYSRDEVWVLDDWRMDTDGQIDPRFVTRHDLAHDGRWGQVITVNGSASQTLNVRPGERIRLRLANTSNGRVYRPDFGALPAQLIATDGMYTRKPLPAKNLVLAPGNRADLDLTIPKDANGRRFVIMDRFTRRPFPLATIVVAGSPVDTPTFAPPSNPQIPVWAGALEQPVDVRYVLNARRGGKHGIEWTINGRAWGNHQPTQLVAGQWSRLRFRNDSGRLHPMHIHGQFFKVLSRNGVAVDEQRFRDTVLVRPKETVDVGMVPLDWGYWMMHCHILEHAEAGMMSEIHVKP